MPKKDFFDVNCCTMDTSEGPVRMPAMYIDGSSVMAFFTSDYDMVMSKLEGTDFVPVKAGRKKALTVLGIFDYRDTSFGPYKEITLSFPVLPDKNTSSLAAGLDFLKKMENRKVGFHIIDIALTIKPPLTAGREIWGYPKFIADVNFRYPEGAFEADVEVRETGDKIFHFRAPFGKGLGSNFFDCIFYSYNNDKVLKTVVSMDSKGKVNTGRKCEMSIGTADHRMIKNMRDLGLDGAKPIFIQTTNNLRYILPEGKTIKECRTPSLPYCE